MSGIIRIKVEVSTNKVGSDDYNIVEFDRDEWNALTDAQREQYCREVMFEMIEWNWEETDAKD
ncbi:hypothetical protein [Castellaniella sp.]|uniref:DUF7167 family protein n=1 Tax=Castellaniella sp. TaxID=1955812 RepID=UPI002AFF8C29|nr:hypothetical protein [Castellaniella sp.]